MSALYKELCAKESEQLKVNPENKGAYKDLVGRIVDCLNRFGNDLNALRVHFKKSAAKSKAKKKSGEAPLSPKTE